MLKTAGRTAVALDVAQDAAAMTLRCYGPIDHRTWYAYSGVAKLQRDAGRPPSGFRVEGLGFRV